MPPLQYPGIPSDDALLDTLQGNILKGHGRDHTKHVFLTFTDKAGARIWLDAIRPALTTAARQARETAQYKATGDSPPFVTLLLSYAGYVALGVPPADIPGAFVPADQPVAKDDPRKPAGSAFREGMKQRAPLLGDAPLPPLGAPPPKAGCEPLEITEGWEPAYRQNEHPIHALLMVAADAPGAITEKLGELLATPGGAALRIATTETGRAQRNKHQDGIEHFGYVDGRSQPLFLKEEIAAEASSPDTDGISVWDPSFPSHQVLVHRDEAARTGEVIGSYFVFRKLEQHVAAFKAHEKELAAALNLTGEAEELAGALVVGRFEDGTPVVRQREEGMHAPVPNNFDYRDDPAASKCPFHAHVRKVNPRGSSLAPGATPEDLENKERSHLMARRGITYGERKQTATPDGQPYMDPDDHPTGGVGLLFQAYMSSLERQFEHVQVNWINDPHFPDPAGGQVGLDPLLGSPFSPHAEIPQSCPLHWGQKDGTRGRFGFLGFVTPRGGEYFFAPTVAEFQRLFEDPSSAAR